MQIRSSLGGKPKLKQGFLITQAANILTKQRSQIKVRKGKNETKTQAFKTQKILKKACLKTCFLIASDCITETGKRNLVRNKYLLAYDIKYIHTKQLCIIVELSLELNEQNEKSVSQFVPSDCSSMGTLGQAQLCVYMSVHIIV